MKPNAIQFLGVENEFTELESSAIAVLPVPYEGAVSYGTGTAEAPAAILKASHYLETYDEVLDFQPYKCGIFTASQLLPDTDHETMHQSIYQHVRRLLDMDKCVAMLGGDHSISSGYFKALQEKYPQLSCIQIDAHSDLRDEYEGSKLSHASVMARIREMGAQTLQIGIRSMSAEEAELVKTDQLRLCTMHQFRKKLFDLDAAISELPDPVFLTFDVDAFDWSVIASTGTPEPGGFLWDEAMDLLETIFYTRNVVGFDIVELSHKDNDPNSTFAVCKLLYKMMGFKIASHCRKHQIPFPSKPNGPLFH